ncbi:MAG: hypothetical protein M9921_15290 [Fimbriimonadaceae bacterium]|nr:hypothetical protein [Fimbriimonadaceae bacterium]
MARLWTLTLMAFLAAMAGAQLSKPERTALEHVLYLGNMGLSDLDFEKRIFSPPMRPELVDLALDHPLQAADALMALHADSGKGELSTLLDLARRRILGDVPDVRPLTIQPTPMNDPGLPASLRAPIERLALNVAQANADVRTALEKLDAAEQRYLIENLPAWATEEPSVKFDFSPNPRPDQAKILELVGRIDLPLMRRAAVMLAKSVEDAAQALRAVVRDEPPFTGVVRFTAYGLKVVLGGVDATVHTDRDAMLTIDLGGNDRYTGRHGAGPGYASVLLDLSGDDVYDVPDLSVGAGLLGIGLAYDLGGNDGYRGKSLAFGAGLAGVGALVDEAGSDTYSASTLALGYGQLGEGICLDIKGNDVYSVALGGEGAARTAGVGWLVDRAGSDMYRAGGLILNAPLFADVYYSNAQGYGSGYREDTGGLGGGVGLLTDHGGDDAYLGETYCQAASYWFAIGSLYDSGGHDTYSAYHYAQASAMHACGAFLFDLAGDDAYAVKVGAAHAIGHDYGVAMLLDRAGNDVVAGRDSRPGTGNANGLGVYLDMQGDDRYFGPPAAGNGARGSGSLGVFVDATGSDRYAEGLEDGAARVGETWEVALDEEGVAVSGGGQTPVPTRPSPTPGSAPLASPNELEAIYEKATQWGVGTAQEEVADNLDRLVAMGQPALEWMLRNKLKAATRLHIRAFVHVVGALGGTGRSMLAPYVADADDDVARVALSVAIDAHATEAGQYLGQALNRPALARLAARAAGALGAKEALPELMPLAASKDRFLALAAVVSMAQIGDVQALGTGQFLLTSSDLPIRKAAVGLVAKFPQQALTIAKTLIEDPNEKSARTGVELLAAVGSPEAMQAAGAALSDPRPGVRVQALLAVDGRCPGAFHPKLVELRSDPSEAVRAVAKRIKGS